MNLKMDFIFKFRNECRAAGRAEKVDEKKWGHFCSFHVPFLSYDPYIVQKSGFFQFCADLSMLKQFTYIHLKGFVTCFQKMLLFTVLQLNVLKI